MRTKRIAPQVVLAAPTTWRPSAALGVVVLHFCIFGCLSGVKGVIWADLLAALQLGEGRFGSAQLMSPLISTIVLFRYASLAAWLQPKLLSVLGVMLGAVALLILSLVPTVWGFLVSLALLGAGTSVLDGAMNQTAMDWEHATRRPVMNFIHACFSGGAVLGSLSAGAGLGAGWSYNQVLVALALVYGLSALVTLAIRYPPTDEAPAVSDGGPGTWRSLVQNPTLRALMIICGLSIVVESVVFLWSVIYLRIDLRAPVVLGSAAFAVFNGAMFAGRMLNGPIVASRGARASLLISGAGLILGTLLLVATRNVALAIGALMVLGLAVAGIFPTMVAAAGAVLPGKSREFTGALMTMTYICFMLAPPLVGWVAELSSLRVALSLVGLCGIGIFWSAWRLQPLPAVPERRH